MIRAIALASILCAIGACAANEPAQPPVAAPERRLERPPGSPPPPLDGGASGGGAVGLDAGEAALAESPGAVPPDEDEVVVPGRIETPLPIPAGDPRTDAQRAEDRRAWDRCVLRAQRRIEEPTSSPSPVVDTPEQACAESLGMAGRDAIPASRR